LVLPWSRPSCLPSASPPANSWRRAGREGPGKLAYQSRFTACAAGGHPPEKPEELLDCLAVLLRLPRWRQRRRRGTQHGRTVAPSSHCMRACAAPAGPPEPKRCPTHRRGGVYPEVHAKGVRTALEPSALPFFGFPTRAAREPCGSGEVWEARLSEPVPGLDDRAARPPGSRGDVLCALCALCGEELCRGDDVSVIVPWISVVIWPRCCHEPRLPHSPVRCSEE
jgi:hypothetical protein